MLLRQLLVGSVVMLLAVGVHASDGSEDDGDHDEEGVSFILGLGASNETSIYEDADDGLEVLPFFGIEWGRYFLLGPRMGAYLYGDEQWSFALSIGLDEAGDLDRGDGSELDDMEDLDNVISGQIEAGYEAEWGEIELTLASDISGKHDGYRVGLAYAYTFNLGRWMIQPAIELEWHSEEVNQYFYGVSKVDARAGRAVYKPAAGVNYGVAIEANYPLNQNHMIQLSAGYTQFSSEVEDSPIVDRDSTTEIGVGYIYRF